MCSYGMTKLPIYSTEERAHLIASGIDNGRTVDVGLLVVLHQQLGMPTAAPPFACEIGRSDAHQRPDSHANGGAGREEPLFGNSFQVLAKSGKGEAKRARHGLFDDARLEKSPLVRGDESRGLAEALANDTATRGARHVHRAEKLKVPGRQLRKG